MYLTKNNRNETTNALVEMATEAEAAAAAAIESLDEAEWIGLTLRVKRTESCNVWNS